MGNSVDIYCGAHLSENNHVTIGPLVLQQYREPTVLPVIVVAEHYAFRCSNILTSRINTMFATVE